MNQGARGRVRPARHTSYFDLLEELARPGCAICRLAKRTTFRYLDMLSYENVNDPGVRATLRGSRGFCNYHAWQFGDEADDGLGTAIIYRDIILNVGRLLPDGSGPAVSLRRSLAEFGSGPSSPGRALAKHLAPRGECLACHQLDLLTRVYVSTLIEHLDDPQLSIALSRSSGLCLPHLRQALARAEEPEQVEFLTRVMGEAYARASHADGDAAMALPLLVGAPGVTLALPPAPDGFVRGEAEALITPGDGCPVCRGAIAAADTRSRELASAKDEAVGALCNNHAARYLDLGLDSDGMIWGQLLAGLGERLLGTPRPAASPRGPYVAALAALGGQPVPRPGADLAKELAPSVACPACLAQQEAEQAITALVSQEEHGALCLSHFALGLLLPTDPRTLRSLATLQGDAYEGIVASLSEFIRKRDYRFTHEPPGEEADSPERAVALVAGARGLSSVGVLPGAPRPVAGRRPARSGARG